MKKLIFFISALSFSLLYAKQPMSAPQIFEKKCAMCHSVYEYHTKEEVKHFVAPPIRVAMRSVTVGVDAIEEPKSKEELKALTVAFVKDYVMNPEEDKAYCEDTVFKRFNTMPSLKGFITQKQLDIVIPYVYEQFAPKE